MNEQNTLQDVLEDFGAQVLAVDPADTARITGLRQNLETTLKSLEAGSPPADLLTLGLAALNAIERSASGNTPRLLDAVAGATAAIVRDMNGENNGSQILAATDALRTLLDAPGASGPSCTLQACADTAPASPPAPTASSSLGADDELVKDFVVESCDRIAAAEAALLALEASPEDKEQINIVLRAFHTVKGASGFLGLDRIQELAHLAENVLIRARDGHIRMVGQQMDVALQTCDALRTIVRSLAPATTPMEAFDSTKLAALLRRLSDSGADRERSSPAVSTTQVCSSQPPQGNDTVSAGTVDVQPGPNVGTACEQGMQGLRVNAERLDELVNMVGELVIAHSIIAQSSTIARGGDHQLARSVSHAGKILRSLQDLSLGLRMVPLRSTFGKMARLVRDVAHKAKKSVQLVTSGENTEIDRNMAEALSDPLVHMIRNAVDHGIEPEEERVRLGKPQAGTIHLRARHSGGNVVIELQDDGRGLNQERILVKARERGWVKEEQELSENDVYSLIFLPGLSTAEQVTDMSGRGMGMDVVKRNVDLLRGKVEVASTPGAGSTFTLRLPLTLAIADAMLLRVGSERFLLPTISIEHSFRPRTGMVSTITGRGEMVMIRDRLLPVFRLGRLFGIDAAVADPSKALLIVIEADGLRTAIMVDELLGQQQVVIKPLGKMFVHVAGVSGAAVLGDGRVGLILDATGLVQLSHGHKRAA